MRKGFRKKLLPGIKRGEELGFTGSKALKHYTWRICNICGEGAWRRVDSYRVVCVCCSNRENIRRWLEAHNNQRRENNPNWKGGRRISKGYVEIRLNPDDPFYPMAKKSGYILEHRFIVAKQLDRFLKHPEQVHHIDGNKQNNSILNLEIGKPHPLGYTVGYKRGYKDGIKARNKELLQEIRLLKSQLNSLRESIQISLL